MTGRDYPRRWLEREHTSGRVLALVGAFVVLVVALVLMLAHSTGEAVRGEVTPATAPDAQPVPFAPRAVP